MESSTAALLIRPRRSRSRGSLYVLVEGCAILSTYDLDTGERIYCTRVDVGSGFSASPIAVDGKIYCICLPLTLG